MHAMGVSWSHNIFPLSSPISTIPYPIPLIPNPPWSPDPQLSVKCQFELFGSVIPKIWSSLEPCYPGGGNVEFRLNLPRYSLFALNYDIPWNAMPSRIVWSPGLSRTNHSVLRYHQFSPSLLPWGRIDTFGHISVIIHQICLIQHLIRSYSTMLSACIFTKLHDSELLPLLWIYSSLWVF